jgi:hypothetical protein
MNKNKYCVNWINNTTCKYYPECKFAHGEHELIKPQSPKINSPCWWFNTSKGCEKSAETCLYQHIKVDNIRKPLHLQHPCYNFHIRGHCSVKECKGDHDYVLTEQEYEHHFKIYTHSIRNNRCLKQLLTTDDAYRIFIERDIKSRLTSCSEDVNTIREIIRHAVNDIIKTL